MKLILFSFIILTACGGANGHDGAQGTQGLPGSVTVINATKCVGTGSLSNETLTLTYSVETYSDGAIYTLCSLSDGSHEYSNNSFNSSCNVVYAVSGNTGAYFSFSETSAVYNDPSGGHNGYTVNMICTSS